MERAIFVVPGSAGDQFVALHVSLWTELSAGASFEVNVVRLRNVETLEDLIALGWGPAVVFDADRFAKAMLGGALFRQKIAALAGHSRRKKAVPYLVPDCGKGRPE